MISMHQMIVLVRYMNRLLEIIREMAVVLARLEKRLVEAESPIETFEPKRIPPLPPPPPPLPSVRPFPHVSTASPTMGLYNMPTLGMPVRVPLPRQTSSK